MLVQVDPRRVDSAVEGSDLFATNSVVSGSDTQCGSTEADTTIDSDAAESVGSDTQCGSSSRTRRAAVEGSDTGMGVAESVVASRTGTLDSVADTTMHKIETSTFAIARFPGTIAGTFGTAFVLLALAFFLPSVSLSPFGMLPRLASLSATLPLYVSLALALFALSVSISLPSVSLAALS